MVTSRGIFQYTNIFNLEYGMISRFAAICISANIQLKLFFFKQDAIGCLWLSSRVMICFSDGWRYQNKQLYKVLQVEPLRCFYQMDAFVKELLVWFVVFLSYHSH